MAMFVERYGKGDRIFFGLHGWSGDHTTFAPLANYLPADASLYCADLPGCGRSQPPLEWRLEELASEIADEISNLDSPSVTVIGNCSGAILALAAMPRIAERVNRLILIDPFAFAPWYFKLFVATPVGKYAYYSTFANPVGRWITNLSLRRHRTGESDLTVSFRAVDHNASYHYLRMLCAIDGIERFAWIRRPIDIVCGERTFGAIKRSVGMWRAVWPHARLFELEGAGHLPIDEATEDLSRIVFRG
ncbi:MAG TPA: alpha/beta fold hydrolase [Blastocatellia bacterium]|nr:alpha/beta fold hydrolase [Blastocatellia bacterium]